MNQLSKNYTFTLIVILLVAAVIRIAGWYGMPYHHDELSALSRLHFSSWGQLFSQGIMVDGHPALVQSFLFVWTGLFGTAEWIVKLPFVLCGIGAVYAAWKLASKWASPAAALFTAAFMAVLELPAFYSVLARPYAPGMLLILWFALVWTRWFDTKKPAYSVCAQYVISALLCSFCHHFSALGAALLGVFGLFVIPRSNLKSYVAVNFTVIAGYLFYLPVTLAQLKFGGLGGDNGWLGSPENNFAWKYIQHVFMYSVKVYAVLALALVVLYYGNLKTAFSFTRFRMAALLLVAAPVVIGLMYSWWVSPIIQFSLLVFFIPFLFIFLFGEGGKNVNERLVNLVALLIVVAGAYTLTFERKYYQHTHDSVFRDAFTLGEEMKHKNHIPNTDVFYVFNENATYLNFYNKNNINFTSYLGKENDAQLFVQDLQQKNKKVVILANPGNTLLSAAKAQYKNVYSLKQSFICEIYAASQTALNTGNPLNPVQKRIFIQREISPNYLNGLEVDSSVEYTPSFGIELKKEKIDYTDYIEVHAVFSCADSMTCNPVVVVEMQMEGKKLWMGSVTTFKRPDKKYHAVVLLRGQDITSIRNRYLNGKCTTYVWNKNHGNFILEEYYFATFGGNPLLYAGSDDIAE